MIIIAIIPIFLLIVTLMELARIYTKIERIERDFMELTGKRKWTTKDVYFELLKKADIEKHIDIEHD